MISVHFQGKPFIITEIQVYAPTSNSEEAEVERFYPETLLKEDGVPSSCGKAISKYRTNVDSCSIQKLSRYFCRGLNNRFNKHLSGTHYTAGISVFKKASS